MAEPLRSVQIAHPVVMSSFRHAAEAAGVYIVLCTAYILFSGALAARIATTPEQLHKIETIKGIAFVVVTGILFFVISYFRWRRIRCQESLLAKEEKALMDAEKKLIAGQSAAVAAHDLNNLLASLSGLVDKLKAREKEDPYLVTMREQINLSIGKLHHLAKRLELSVGRSLSEKKEQVDMKSTINDLACVLQTHPDVSRCRVATSDIVPLTLFLHRTLFEEAVINLLINAAQATGPSGQIEVRLTTEPGSALLSVHDNGPGVPDFLMKDIFEPLFTTKPGGSGIGLLAVSAFATSCEAKLSVGRSPAGGAMFQLRIPLPPEKKVA